MASSRRRARNDGPAEDVDDIWKIVSSKSVEVETQKQAETYTLFVGQKQAGKSSIITAFHNPSKEDAPKPTVALEYLFARRSAGPNQPKDIAHIWELGGGFRLSSLVSVPVTPQTISNMIITVVVDLSQPNNVLQCLKMWLDLIRSRVDECLHTLRVTDPTAADEMMTDANARFTGQGGKPHPDVDVVTPIYCPVIIIGNKLDSLKDKEPIERRILCQALRFMAHQVGASFLTCGTRDKASQVNLRSLLSAHLFKSSSGSKVKKEVNSDKPNMVMAGTDSFEEILKNLPKGTDRSDFIGARGISIDVMNTWASIFEHYFGAVSLIDEDTAVVEDDGMEKMQTQSEFAENSVDDARAQRDSLLEQYRKEAERKRRMASASSSRADRKASSKSKSKSTSSEAK